MHGSDRSRYDQVVLGLLGAIALIVLVVVIWTSASLSERYSHRAQQAAESYGYAAEEDISRTCGGRDFAATAKCIKEIIEATREAQTAQYDLAAQRDMALWAFAMFWIALFSLALTCVGIFFVKQTLDANRAIVEKAAEANRNARELGEAQVRAYLTFQDVRIDFDWYLPRVRFKLFNAGNSPATNIVATGGCIRETVNGTGPVFTAGAMVGTLRAGVESDSITIYVGQPIHEIITTQVEVPMSLMKAMLRVTFEDVFAKTRRLRGNFVGVVEGSHRDKKALFVREELSLTAVDRFGPGVLEDDDED